MNPLVAGLSAGTLMALAGFLLLWPILGQDLMKVFGRFVTVFLVKLFLVAITIIVVHKVVGAVQAGLFATGLLATYLVLMMVQLLLFSRRLKHFEAIKGAEDATKETENGSLS